MVSRSDVEICKRLKTIYEDEDFEFDDIVTGKELVERIDKAKKFSEFRIKDVFRRLRLTQNVDLCFLVDATYSMQPYIDEVRNSIYLIIDSLTKKATVDSDDVIAKQIRLSLVAYRDFDDEKQVEVFPFNESVDDFRNSCNSIKATGGGDAAEDVFTGFEEALKLDWSTNSGTKVVFHIADAPCHGRDFHTFNYTYDRHLDGDPKGRNHEEIFKKFNSKQIQYYFGKINNSTDKMIAKFSYAYTGGEPITDFNLNDLTKICGSVVRAVTISVSRSKSKSASTSISIKKIEKPYKIDDNEPNWDCIKEEEGVFLAYIQPKNVEDIIDCIYLKEETLKKAVVKIAENPFAKGNERIAYYGKDLSPYVEDETVSIDSGEVSSVSTERLYPRLHTMNEDIVLKEYKFEGSKWASGLRFEEMNQLQTIASFLASSFGNDVKACGGKSAKLKFLKIRTLAINGEKKRYMSCEKRYKKEDKFIRFTNNTDYHMLEEEAMEKGIDESFVQMLMAFSHWTYIITSKYLMVVDLQGVVTTDERSGEKIVELTDPAIHCIDVTRFHPTNLGKDGMEKFLKRHECNRFCVLLGLDSTDT